MLSSSFSQLVLYFMLYSMLGWICETITCSFGSKKLINRGFLEGPYCPIYGFGAVFILAATVPVMKYPILVFLFALIITTLLEYFTGWLLEKLFAAKLWDYSKRKLQYKGRICLKNSLVFGLMGTVLTYFVHPLAASLLSRLQSDTLRVLASILIVLVFIDLLRTISTMLGLNERLRSLKTFFTELERYDKEHNWYDKENLTESLERLRIICEEDTQNEEAASTLRQLDAIIAKRDHSFRVMNSYPNMKAKEMDAELKELKGSWEAEGTAPMEHIKKAVQTAGSKTISVAKEFNPFAAEMSFYKLVWIFIIASVLGYFIETVFCLVTRGVIESRQGLLYGPFSQIYGIGAVIMVVFLTPFSKKSDRWLFIGGAVLGGAFEYLASLFQEYVFGSVSWEYSNQRFSIGGRTSLLFMLFWGILSVVFMKGIYPKISDIIKKISMTRGIMLTWILIALLSVDIILSAGAVLRWRQRLDSIAPNNQVEEFFDNRYPNEMMEEIYPNMKMIYK